MKSLALVFMFVMSSLHGWSQSSTDTSYRYITLAPVVVGTRLNIPYFISKVRTDTGFYKAFRNLRILEFTSINDIRMLGRSKQQLAAYHSKTRQERVGGCRQMTILEQESSGDFFDRDHQYNYYTADLFASLFFTTGKVCGETNVVGNAGFSLKDKKGMEKHKEQLKMLFFNPGRRISGLPFMSGKTEIFDEDVAENYDMSIDMEMYNQTNCYVLRQKVKPGREGQVVVDEMTTWMADSTLDILARNYSLSYDAGVYDFKVDMEVQLTRYKDLIVPSLIRYYGNWKAIFKKRERGVFTVTLSDYAD